MMKEFFVVLGVIAALQLAAGEGCTFPIGSKRHFTLQWPLIFDKSGKLYPTTYDDISGEVLVRVKSGEQVTLSCGPNYFKHQFRVEAQTAVCNGATGNFTVNNSEHAASDLTCDLRVVEEVLDDVYGCVDAKWTAARFGYVDPNEKKTILLGEVCYDMAAGVTRFVHMNLGGPSHLEELSKSYLTSRRHPDGRYKIELMRGLHFDDIYERIRSTLHTRHTPNLGLSHFVDEALLSSPQFQAVKKLGWNYFVGYDENETLESLKRAIKHLSESSNLEIYVGSHGVKQLNGENDEKMEIYLHDAVKRFPMPGLLWFVVKHEEKATAIGVVNDAESPNHLDGAGSTNTDFEHICKMGDCSKVTWLSPDLKHDSKIICCDVNDFRKTIQEVPILADVKEMLI